MLNPHNIANKFIDIHTHKNISEQGNCFVMQNFFPENIKEIKHNQFYSIGIHPWYARNENINDQIKILKSSVSSPNCLAVGEAGLDHACETNYELQNKVFLTQAEIAESERKPLIIHCVRAYQEVIKIRKDLKSDVSWIVHGFRGNIKTAESLIDNGFHLSFGAAIINLSPEKCVLPAVPANKLFLETDENTFGIEEIYDRCAQHINISVVKLKKSIAANFIKVFCNDEKIF